MKVRFLLLADAANASREGKLNIAGEFNTIYSGAFPFAYPQLVVVARLEIHPGEALQQAAQLKITDADGTEILSTAPMPIQFATGGPGIPARADVIIGLAGVVIPNAGDYAVHLVVNGVQRDDTTFYVRAIPTK